MEFFGFPMLKDIISEMKIVSTYEGEHGRQNGKGVVNVGTEIVR